MPVFSVKPFAYLQLKETGTYFICGETRIPSSSREASFNLQAICTPLITVFMQERICTRTELTVLFSPSAVVQDSKMNSFSHQMLISYDMLSTDHENDDTLSLEL